MPTARISIWILNIDILLSVNKEDSYKLSRANIPRGFSLVLASQRLLTHPLHRLNIPHALR